MGNQDLAKQLAKLTDRDGKSIVSGKIKAKNPAAPVLANNSTLPWSGTAPTEKQKTLDTMLSGAPKKKVAIPSPPPAKFRPIPFFKFAHQGTTAAGLTEKGCQQKCEGDDKCLSFSYSAEHKLCITSDSCVLYDLAFDFYVKRDKTKEGDASFRNLGAMKYAWSGTSSTKVKSTSGQSLNECKAA